MSTWICSDCLGENEYFNALIESEKNVSECGYCGYKGNVISFDTVSDCVHVALNNNFSDAYEDSPRDPETGKYYETTYDTSEAIQDLFISDSNLGECAYGMRLIDDLVTELDTEQLLCQKYWRGDDYDGILSRSWASFCDIIKYKICHYMYDAPLDEFFDFPPNQILDAVVDVIVKCGLIRSLSSDNPVIFRARRTEEIANGADKLGSPPKNVARSSRMSPAGISHFYGSFDLQTALIEIMQSNDNYTGYVCYSEWRIIDSLLIVDFTNLPKLPSVFDREQQMLRDVYAFLNSFLRDIASPVPHDNREHIEYAPTQIISEYLRSKIMRIDGIMYNSSYGKGKCIALFPHDDSEKYKPEHKRLKYESDAFLEYRNGMIISTQSKETPTARVGCIASSPDVRSILFPDPESLVNASKKAALDISIKF